MAKDKNNQQDFPGQHEDEEVQFVFRQHPIVLRKGLLLSLVIILVSILPLAFIPTWNGTGWFALSGITIAVLILVYRWLSWYFSVYIATNERLIQIKQKGFFDRRVVDISLGHTQGVNYEIKGVQATLFHFGTIILQTFVGDVKLEYIHNPADVQQGLIKIIRTQPSEM